MLDLEAVFPALVEGLRWPAEGAERPELAASSSAAAVMFPSLGPGWRRRPHVAWNATASGGLVCDRCCRGC